jgi:hypothetical protein
MISRARVHAGAHKAMASRADAQIEVYEATVAQCLLYPQKRTWELAREMSALCQKRTSTALLDHLVGEVQ